MKGFLQIKNEEVLSRFEELLKDVNDKPKRFTSADLHKRIDIAEKDFKEGNYKTSNDLLLK